MVGLMGGRDHRRDYGTLRYTEYESTSPNSTPCVTFQTQSHSCRSLASRSSRNSTFHHDERPYFRARFSNIGPPICQRRVRVFFWILTRLSQRGHTFRFGKAG
jgi:hypothetical protein